MLTAAVISTMLYIQIIYVNVYPSLNSLRDILYLSLMNKFMFFVPLLSGLMMKGHEWLGGQIVLVDPE